MRANRPGTIKGIENKNSLFQTKEKIIYE